MAKNRQKEYGLKPDAPFGKTGGENVARGTLTVFLGAMAGVGKTFAMLQAARERRRGGEDVVIGWTDARDRAETAELAEGFWAVAPKVIFCQGKRLEEMDVNAVLARRPDLAVVDDLAHSNLPGSRYRHRYQDIEALLAAGIDVYTSINIGEIENLSEIAAQVTGTAAEETVPDAFLEKAGAIRFVDAAPQELTWRLKEGKTCPAAQAQKAAGSFLAESNFSVLRELALCFMTRHVDKDSMRHMRAYNGRKSWRASGKVMVGVSGSPFSAQLIRAAARLAAGLGAELLAVHVQVSASHFPMGDKECDGIARSMRLAEGLGAKTLTAIGDDFADEFLKIAKNQNVTAIVIGKPRHRRFLEFIRGGSVVDRIVCRSGGINVYALQGLEAEKGETASCGGVKRRKFQPALYAAYFSCLIMTMAVVGGLYFFNAHLSEIDAAMLSLIPVILSAVWWGRWLSYFAAFLNVLSFNFLFVKPLYQLTVDDFQYLWSFVIFLLVSFLIGERTERLHKEMRRARRQEKSTQAVYEFSRDIIAVAETAEIGKWLARYAGEIIECKTVVALPEDGVMTDHLFQFDFFWDKSIQPSRQGMSGAEFAVIDWVYKNKREAGRSTDILPGGDYLYLPIGIKGKVYGVLGVYVGEKLLTPRERRLLDAWVRLAAIAMERADLTQQAYQAALLMEADKLRGALFSSISHELKTPLAATLASVSMLLEPDVPYTKEDRRELLTNIKESSLRMERLIVNLLDTARLESGMMQLKYDWCDIQDLFGTTLRHMGERLKDKNIKVELGEDLPLIQADFVLLEQVLINLVDNAVKYSPREAEIILRAEKQGNLAVLSVLDNGCGIPEECIENIFQKFYRVKRQKENSGTGLGLSICKGIVEAHHGTIRAENRPGGGVCICFALPVSPLKKLG